MSALATIAELAAKNPALVELLGRAAGAALKSKDPFAALLSVLLREAAKRTAHATAKAGIKALRKTRG